IKAITSVDQDMNRTALDIVNIHLVMPPRAYRTEGELFIIDGSGAPKTTELVVSRNGKAIPFLEIMDKDPYYRLEVDRELTLPVSVSRFLYVPSSRCLLSL